MINTSITQPLVDKEIRELERDKRIKDVSQRVTSTKDTATKDATRLNGVLKIHLMKSVSSADISLIRNLWMPLCR